MIFNKLEQLEKKYEDISKQLNNNDMDFRSKQYLELAKEHNSIEKTIQLYRNYKETVKRIKEAEELVKAAQQKDPELEELGREELANLKQEQEHQINELRYALLPKDTNSKKNVIVEIRAGTGGNEAALFVADLYRMYIKYTERKKWKVELLNSHLIEVGGYKEITFSVSGKEVYNSLKYEMGGHRVQRIPETESGGRIHTSAVTVAILPEAEETEIKILPNDIKIDVFRSSGPGGQSVNTTDSAVRITHISSGIVVQCQDEKSQHKNKAKAMRVLRARLFEKMNFEKQQERAEERKSQIGSGNRSDRIRTYNFTQNRVTDHRINLSIYNKLENILNGALDELILPLINHERKSVFK